MSLIVNREEIEEWLYAHKIDNYSFTGDMEIKVKGDVDLSNRKLTHFPVSFYSVSGNFDCSENKLVSLKGAPQVVGGHFDCTHNNLSSLLYAPQKVMGKFNCGYNQLTSLEHGPLHVRGSFGCYSNKITNLKFAPKYVGQNFHCGENSISSLEDLTTELNDNFALFCDINIIELQEYFKSKNLDSKETSSCIYIDKLKIIREKWQLLKTSEIPAHKEMKSNNSKRQPILKI